MPYRFLFCPVCGTRLRFFRDVERGSIGCPECGTGMDLGPRNMVARLPADFVLSRRRRFVPMPELLPASVVRASIARRRYRVRNLLLGLVTIAAAAVLLLKSGLLIG